MKVARFEFSLFGINSYVVYDPEKKECAVIDPGMMDKEEEGALAGFISRNGLKVTNIINTHLHIDHVIGDSFASKKYGVGISANPADAALGKRLQNQADMFGLSARVEDVEITFPLTEGDVIRIGGGELEVMHVPGHSPGSIVLYDRKDGFVIAGDVLFNGSVGRADLPGGNMVQLIEGIKKKLLVLPDETVVYPGHGPATTIGQERRTNPFLR